MVAYFCRHLSDNYVDLSDLFVLLSDLYVDLSLIHSLENKAYEHALSQFCHTDNNKII